MSSKCTAAKAYDILGIYDISVETHDMASGKDALLADAPQRDAPAKDTQNIG